MTVNIALTFGLHRVGFQWSICRQHHKKHLAFIGMMSRFGSTTSNKFFGVFVEVSTCSVSNLLELVMSTYCVLQQILSFSKAARRVIQLFIMLPLKKAAVTTSYS